MKNGILIFAILLSATMASYSMQANRNFTKINTSADTVTMVVINDNFVAQVLNRDLTIPKILKAYHYINTYVKLIPNKSTPKLKDTLITFTKGKTTYTFFKASDGNTLTAANIESNTISTAGIKVGLSKDNFEKIINVPHVSDIVIIEDKERTHRFVYTFNGEKIATIKYESPYHDY